MCELTEDSAPCGVEQWWWFVVLLLQWWWWRWCHGDGRPWWWRLGADDTARRRWWWQWPHLRSGLG
jgi:hypothetical protein